ncbi:transporter substrate-binding domain-containing protein [Terrisporobacter sp.]|uniref:transporter substrate-binding domain-containing protein n=1 Tax=Terrisporobacter sp. TaxID=1965305 RepID=UPI0026173496|nr:transporter substrate-binding domain-containing protein [Terrisporobacter sp.]
MKGLKKLLGLTLGAMMTISLVGCSSGSNEGEGTVEKLQQIKDAGVLVVGTSADYAPYEFHKQIDGEDKIVGFDITMAEEIAKDLGVKVEYKDMDFDGLLGALEAEKVDIVLSGMTPDEERKKSVDFSELFYEDSNVCIVKKGKEDSIKSEDDLKKLKVGVQSGTTQADFITGDLGITDAKQLKRMPDLMLDLQNGNIDVIVTGKNVANINIGQYDGLAIGKTTVGKEVAESTAAAIKKSNEKVDNTSLVESINNTIKRLKDENKMDEYMQEALKLAEK